MTLALVKIEEGLCDGEVLFHTHITKTSEQIAELRKRNNEKKHLKEQRQREQAANVERKRKKQQQQTPSTSETMNESDE